MAGHAFDRLETRCSLIYYGLVSLGLFLSVVARRRGMWIIFTAALLVSVFRYGVGNDYFSYKHLYELFLPNPLDEVQDGVGAQEVGFRFLGAVWKWAGLGYPSFVGLFAVINLLFVAITSRRFSPNPSLTFTLYLAFHLLVWTFSGMRQGVVMAVGVYLLLRALETKYRRDRLIFVVVSVLLLLIHASAFILFVMYFVGMLDLKRSTIMIIGAGALAIALIPNSLILGVVQVAPLLNRAIPYIDNGGTGSVLDFQGVVRLGLLGAALIFYDTAVRGREINRIIVQLYVFSFVIYFGLQVSELVAARMSIYGRYLDILVFPLILHNLRGASVRALAAVILAAYSFIYLQKEVTFLEANFVVQERSEGSWLTPYTHYWNIDKFHFGTRSLPGSS